MICPRLQHRHSKFEGRPPVFFATMESGKFYGYPQCCIDEFIEHKHLKGDQEALMARIKEAGLYNCGFVPCEAHLQKLIDGEISVKSLIKDRQCKNPFPIGRYSVIKWGSKRKRYAELYGTL